MCIYDLHDFPRNGNRDGLIWKMTHPAKKIVSVKHLEKKYLKPDFQFT